MSTVLVDRAPEVVVSTSTNNALVNVSVTNVVVSNDTSNIVRYIQETHTPVAIGIQGPQGIPGASDNFIYLVAAENLGGSRAISASASGAIYASTSSINILGISAGATSAGQVAQIQISGIITEPSWSWAHSFASKILTVAKFLGLK